MSRIGLRPVAQVDPIIPGVIKMDSYGIPMGTYDQNWQIVQAQQYSATQISYANFINQKNNVIYDGRILQRHQMQFTFAGTSTGPLLLIGSADAPRAFPFANAVGTGTIALNVNGTQFNEAMDVFQQLHYLGDYRQARKGLLSTCPCMPDQFQNYGDWITFGAARNPLGLHGDNPYDEPRGGFPGITVVSNTANSAVINLDWYEPFLVAPLKQYQASQGLQSLQSVQINCQITNWARAWSHDSTNGNTISSITATYLAPPSLYLRLLFPQSEEVPAMLFYPFGHISNRNYVTGTVVTNAGASGTISSMQVVPDFVPREIIFFLRPTQTTYFPADVTAANQSDCCMARINSFQLQWGGTTSQFTSAQSIDLYRLSQFNDYDCSWVEWNKTKGSIIKLVAGKDFKLNPGEYVGAAVKTQFYINNINFTNINSTKNITYDLVILPMNSGAIQIAGNSAARWETVVAEGDDKRALQSFVGYHSRSDMEFAGSGLFDGIRNAFNFVKDNAGSIARTGAKIVGALAPQYSGHANTIAGMFGGRGGRRPNFRGGGFVDDSQKDQYVKALQAPRGGGPPAAKKPRIHPLMLPMA